MNGLHGKPAFSIEGILLILMLGAGLSPLFFINMGNSFGWGDDFAQYIHQSVNMLTGQSQMETRYVYNPAFAMLGPPAYPPGFPLLLVPVSFLSSAYPVDYVAYMSLWAVAFACLSFGFLSHYFSNFSAFLLMLVLIYNPGMLFFKREVMADLPFAVFFLSVIIAGNAPQSRTRIVMVGLLAGCAMLLKAQGWIFPLVFIISEGRRIGIACFSNKCMRTKQIGGGLIPAIVIMLSVWFVVQYICFDIPPGYGDHFHQSNLLNTIGINLEYYLGVVFYFFGSAHGFLSWMTLPAGGMVIALFFLGIIHRLKRPGFEDFVFIVYMGMLLVYPYQGSGFRLLIPVMPWFLMYAGTGYRIWMPRIVLKRRIIAFLCAGLLFFQYLPAVYQLAVQDTDKIQGPHERESLQAFAYINQYLPAKSLIVFAKPRAWALYTQESAMGIHPLEDEADIARQLTHYRAEYILFHQEIEDPSLRNWMMNHPEHIERVWKNDTFELFRFKP